MESYIKHGDCLEVMKDIPDKSIDMILCDLPYGTTQCKWDVVIPFDKLWEQYCRVAKDNAAIVLFGAEPFSSRLRLSNLQMYKYDWIWDKVKGTGFLNAKKQPLRNHEVICVFYKSQCTYNPQMTSGQRKVSYRRKGLQTDVYGQADEDYIYDSAARYPRSIQVFSADTQKCSLHPTQKPIALLEYLIRTYTNDYDIVLDNCMGSGSTCIAAQNTNRKYTGIESEESIFNTAKDRIKMNKTQLQLF